MQGSPFQAWGGANFNYFILLDSSINDNASYLVLYLDNMFWMKILIWKVGRNYSCQINAGELKYNKVA